MKTEPTNLIIPSTDAPASNGGDGVEKSAGAPEDGPGKLREETPKALATSERAGNFRSNMDLADAIEAEMRGITAEQPPTNNPAPPAPRSSTRL